MTTTRTAGAPNALAALRARLHAIAVEEADDMPDTDTEHEPRVTVDRIALLPSWQDQLARWAADFDLSTALGRGRFHSRVVGKTRQTPIRTLRQVALDLAGVAPAARPAAQRAISDGWIAKHAHSEHA